MSWDALIWLSIIALSYLIGGIHPAYFAARVLAGRDIRSLGDHNSGAANVFRNVDPKVGVLVGAVDILKGAAVILLARALVDSTALEMMAGLAVLAGHNWPVYLGFRGGRGAAAGIGVMLATVPALAVPLGAIAFAVLLLCRRATLAIACFFTPVAVLAWWPYDYPYQLAIYSAAVPVLVGVTHFLSIRDLPPRRRMDTEAEHRDERMLPQG